MRLGKLGEPASPQTLRQPAQLGVGEFNLRSRFRPCLPPLCPPSCLLSGSFEPWPRKGSGSFRGSSPSLWVPLGWLLVTGNDKGSPVLSHLSGSHMGESRFLRPRLRSDPLGLGFTPGLPAGRAGDSASLGSEVPVALPCGFSGGSAAGQKRQTTEQGCWTGNAPRAPHGVVRSHFRPPKPPGLGPGLAPAAGLRWSVLGCGLSRPLDALARARLQLPYRRARAAKGLLGCANVPFHWAGRPWVATAVLPLRGGLGISCQQLPSRGTDSDSRESRRGAR